MTENLGYYLDLYNTWSSYEPESKGILIAYASIHGNTGKAAEKLAEILRSKGAEKVVVSDLAREDMAEVIEDAFRYDRMIVAAASYDGGVFPLHAGLPASFAEQGISESQSWNRREWFLGTNCGTHDESNFRADEEYYDRRSGRYDQVNTERE